MKGNGMTTVLFAASVIAVVLALVDAMSVDVWLAASTWLIIAAIFGIWAILTKNKK